MVAFLKLIRAFNLFIIALGIVLFYYLIVVPNHLYKLENTLVPFNVSEVILFVLAVLLIAAGGNIINDYLDLELDKSAKPGRPLPSGAIGLNTAVYLHTAFTLAGVALGFYLGYKNGNYKLGYLFVISALLLYVYSAYLKKIPLAGNLVISCLTAFVFVLLIAFEANFFHLFTFANGPFVFSVIMQLGLFYAAFAFITTLAREIVKDIEDMEGDAAYEVNTFAVMFGPTAAKILAILTIAALLAGIGYYAYGFYTAGALKEMSYWIIAIILPALAALFLLVRAKTAKQYHQVSTLLKIIMLLGILSIPAFYLIRS